MKTMKTKRAQGGFILISVYWLVVFLVALAVVAAAYAYSDLRASQRLQANVQALYLAEAGVDQAIVQLRQNYAWTAGYAGVPAGNSGTYSVQVSSSGNRRILTAQGSSTLLPSAVQRFLEVVVQKSIPPGFFDNTIWASQDLVFNGNAYVVTGNVRHGDLTPSSNTGGVSGSITYDAAANPLPRLSFRQLHDIAQAQGNLYDAARLAGGSGVFPTSFWYRPPTDPNDPSTGVPNVNYITTDLVLNGNIGTIGGFFVVVGDVLTDPNSTEDTTINGNGQILGAIYTTGNFRINGGGAGLNVTGGVWAGNEVRLDGHASLAYSTTYMKAIQSLGINADVQVLSWREPS